jgi:drug/metabolite transporter (DMT)-like permease
MGAVWKVFSYLFVGALWGITNPFLKQGAQISSPSSTSSLSLESKETTTLFQRATESFKSFLRPSIILPIAINQLGSLAFYFLLATDDISIAVPLCNSLTFAFTGVTGWLLGERIHQPILFVLGIALVLSGIYLCVLS